MSLHKPISHKTLKKRNPTRSRDRSLFEGGENEIGNGKIKTAWEEIRGTQLEIAGYQKSQYEEGNFVETPRSHYNSKV